MTLYNATMDDGFNSELVEGVRVRRKYIGLKNQVLEK